jgi:hypothetical protein
MNEKAGEREREKESKRVEFYKNIYNNKKKNYVIFIKPLNSNPSGEN